MKSWKEQKLEDEVRRLRGVIKSCLELIEDLSHLDAPLFEANLPVSFKKKYVRVVKRAKKFSE